MKKKIRINEVIGKWIHAKLEVHFSESYFNFYLDNEIIMEESDFLVDSCGEPHFKFGIYRPGDEEAAGERISILDVDKIWLVEMKKK